MPYDLTSEWNVVNKTSKQKITRDIEIRNKLTVTRGEETKGITGERKKEILPFSTAWMDLESILLSEISQVVKDKCHMISPISGT